MPNSERSANIITIEQITPIHYVAARDLPEGDYPGIWGGYEVKVQISAEFYRIKTVEGTKSRAAACIVRIEHDVATIIGPGGPTSSATQ